MTTLTDKPAGDRADITREAYSYIIHRMPPDNDPRETTSEEKVATLGAARTWAKAESAKDPSLLVHLYLLRADSWQFVLAYRAGRTLG